MQKHIFIFLYQRVTGTVYLLGSITQRQQASQILAERTSGIVEISQCVRRFCPRVVSSELVSLDHLLQQPLQLRTGATLGR